MTPDSGEPDSFAQVVLANTHCCRCSKPRLVGDSYCLEHRRELRRLHARKQRRQLRWAKKMLRGLSMEELDAVPRTVQTDD